VSIVDEEDTRAGELGLKQARTQSPKRAKMKMRYGDMKKALSIVSEESHSPSEKKIKPNKFVMYLNLITL
jgi:hypothetical protein